MLNRFFRYVPPEGATSKHAVGGNVYEAEHHCGQCTWLVTSYPQLQEVPSNHVVEVEADSPEALAQRNANRVLVLPWNTRIEPCTGRPIIDLGLFLRGDNTSIVDEPDEQEDEERREHETDENTDQKRD